MSDFSTPVRKLAAIVFTDIVGFTKLTADDQSKASSLLKQQRDLLRPIVESFHGSWIKEIGDGLLLIFDTVTDAVNCSIKIQEETKNIENLDLRIGIHQGEILLEENDVIGDDVNVASRIEPFSASGGVAISSKVNDALVREKEFETKYLGKPKLKGVGQEVKVYCITSHGLPETKVSKVSAKLEPEGFQWNVFSLTGAVLTIIGVLFWINISFVGIGISKELDIPSVAILYMKNLGSADDELWAYGLTEDLIIEMSNKGLIQVKSMKAILNYKDTDLSENEIADDLSVRYILTSSFHKTSENFDLKCQFFDIHENVTLFGKKWSESIDNSSLIVSNLANALTDKMSLKDLNIQNEKYRADPVAYEYYMKGKYKLKHQKSAQDKEEARTYFNKAIEIDPKLLEAIMALAAFYFYQENDRERYLKYFKQLIVVGEELGEHRWIADGINGIGIYKGTGGEIDSAEYYFEKFLEYCLEHKINPPLSYAYSNLATIYSMTGRVEKAFQYMEKSFEYSKLYSTEEDERISGMATMAGVYILWCQFGKAIALLDKGFKSAQKNDFILQKAELLRSEALLYSFLGDLDRAIPLAKEAGDIFKEADLKRIHIMILNDIAGYHIDGKQFEEAHQSLNDVQALADLLDAIEFDNQYLNLKAEYYFGQGQFKEALEPAESLYKNYKEMGTEYQKLSSLLMRALCNQNLNNKKESDILFTELENYLSIIKLVTNDDLTPFRIYQVYKNRNMTEKSREYLKFAYDNIMKRAENIIDPQKKKQYLSNVKTGLVLKAWKLERLNS